MLGELRMAKIGLVLLLAFSSVLACSSGQASSNAAQVPSGTAQMPGSAHDQGGIRHTKARSVGTRSRNHDGSASRLISEDLLQPGGRPIQFQMSVSNADGGGRRIGPVICRGNDPDPSTSGRVASRT